MSRIADLAAAVADVYAWIDTQTVASEGSCRACGQCCDFALFDHRLFVTSVELLYFRNAVPDSVHVRMPAEVCPYRVDSKCSVYDARFAGCRIFACSGDTDSQNRLSEQALARFKQISDEFNVPYVYMDLKTALNAE
ncbi:MAG TPA: hypothetical protein P5279_16420 [Anaerohalosphaeraceae bacterium]|jgi:hypothetical protein|nr:hypothetical protein [Anaerohalosphaeraceae bacterium]HRT52075.1 hypothetical protein [Anaerohalosphaeraceae bacterium]HRT88195.1 hypothetical protein [Anaerohalosphaeraceae bacterium]